MSAVRLRIARRLLARAIAGLSRPRRDWGEALAREVDSLPSDERVAFALGGVVAAWRIRVRDAGVRPWLVLAGAATLVGWVNTSTSDVANQATLVVVLAGAAASGYVHPPSWRLAGLALGLVVPVSGAVTLLAGETQFGTPRGWNGPIVLSTLCIPALVAAYCGAAARRASLRGKSEDPAR